MVQAILDGRKTQTRRLLKLKHYHDHNWTPTKIKEEHIDGIQRWEMRCGSQYTLPIFKCPYGEPGDLLWVRESWQHWFNDKMEPSGVYLYKADDDGKNGIGWKPSIHMPKEAARIWLEVKNVRAERLQDISEEDSKAEGVERWIEERMKSKPTHYKVYCDLENPNDPAMYSSSAKYSFETLWHLINGLESWEANPWVWVIEFKVEVRAAMVRGRLIRAGPEI